MNRTAILVPVGLVLLSLFPAYPPSSATETPDGKARELIAANVIAAGGKEKLDAVRNLSFRTVMKDYRTVATTYHADNAGRMKMTVGLDPLVERVTLVDGEKIKERNFLTDGALSSLERVELRALAGLFGGMFTLERFRDRLRYDRSKRYGSSLRHILSMEIDGHEILFHLDDRSSLVAGIVIRGRNEAGVKYESCHDFGEPAELHGLRIPTLWLHTFIGPGGESRGRNRIEEFTPNPEVEEGFLEKGELNFGKVSFKDGVLTGNAMEAFYRDSNRYVVMATNIRWKDVEALGVEHGDELVVTLGDETWPGYFLPIRSNNLPRECYRRGVLLFGDIKAPYLGFHMLGEIFMKYDGKVPPMLKTTIARKPADSGGER